MKFKTKVMVWLNNSDLLLDIRSVLILTVSILLPLLYFLYSKNFSLATLFDMSFGVLALFVILGNIMTWLEVGSKSNRDEINENEKLKQTIKDTKAKQLTLPKKIDTIIDFNKFYNKEKQNNRNKQLTNLIISKLEKKINSKKIKGKSTIALETEIESLEKNNLYDKTYKPVKIENIISIEKKTPNQIEGNDSIYINPVLYGWKRFALKQPLKAMSIGGSGMFILSLNQDGWTVFLFYVIYIVSLALLLAFRYPSVRKITKTLYKDTLDKKQVYIEEYHEWYTKEYPQEETKQEEVVEVKLIEEVVK